MRCLKGNVLFKELSCPCDSSEDNGAPEEIRTPDPRFRKPLLYPTELQAHNGRGSKIRTYDHSLPKRVRYQTALYPEGFTRIA